MIFLSSSQVFAIPNRTQANDPVQDQFTVIVSGNGFNETAGKFNITVSQGDLVTIKFIYRDDSNASHQIAIEDWVGFNISQSNPIAIMRITTNRPGVFSMYCDDVQSGILIVMRSPRYHYFVLGDFNTNSSIV
jgi:hypothetical protein